MHLNIGNCPTLNFSRLPHTLPMCDFLILFSHLYDSIRLESLLYWYSELIVLSLGSTEYCACIKILPARHLQLFIDRYDLLTLLNVKITAMTPTIDGRSSYSGGRWNCLGYLSKCRLRLVYIRYDRVRVVLKR